MILPVDPEMLATLLRERLDTDHKPQGADRPDPVPGRPAAVLVGLVPRASGVTILLTRRAAHQQKAPGPQAGMIGRAQGGGKEFGQCGLIGCRVDQSGRRLPAL